MYRDEEFPDPQELDDIRRRARYALRRSSHTTTPSARFDWERIADAYGEIAKALERLTAR